jgi:hypothetical protein
MYFKKSKLISSILLNSDQEKNHSHLTENRGIKTFFVDLQRNFSFSLIKFREHWGVVVSVAVAKEQSELQSEQWTGAKWRGNRNVLLGSDSLSTTRP